MGAYEFDPTTLGITTSTAKLDITLFPNPTNDLVTVSFNNATVENSTLFLYDIHGRLVKTIAAQQNRVGGVSSQIDLSAQHAGIYFLSVRTKNGTYVKKIIRK